MKESSKFMVAVHVLSLLAYVDGAVNSEFIAGSVNTHAVVIRRVLGDLAKAGFVRSVEGASGGYLLTKMPSDITLEDVYTAVEGQMQLFGRPRNHPNPLCPVGRNVQSVLLSFTDRVAARALDDLNKITLADILAGIRAAKT